MKSISQIMNEVKKIRNAHGHKYFIKPGSNTSQSVTGTKNYYSYIYIVEYADEEETLFKIYELENCLKTAQLNNIKINKIHVDIEETVNNSIYYDHQVRLGTVHIDKLKAPPMAKVIAISKMERYCDCPYCNTLISDEINVSNMFFERNTGTCPNCKRKFIIEEVEAP